MAASAIAAVAVAVSAYSAQKQIEASEEAAEARKKQQRLAKKRADIKAARERVQLLRQQRRAVAESQTAAVTSGAATGSAAAGAVGSIRSQTAGAASFLGAQQRLGGNIFRAGIAQTKAQESAAMWGSVGSVSSSIFSAAGGWQQIGSAFQDSSQTSM